MKHLSVPAEEILSCEYSFDYGKARSLIGAQTLPSVYAVRLPSGKYVSPEGHHRNLARYLSNEHCPLVLIETDQEWREQKEDGFRKCRSLEEFFLFFHMYRKQHLKPRSIDTIPDLAERGERINLGAQQQ